MKNELRRARGAAPQYIARARRGTWSGWARSGAHMSAPWCSPTVRWQPAPTWSGRRATGSTRRARRRRATVGFECAWKCVWKCAFSACSALWSVCTSTAAGCERHGMLAGCIYVTIVSGYVWWYCTFMGRISEITNRPLARCRPRAADVRPCALCHLRHVKMCYHHSTSHSDGTPHLHCTRMASVCSGYALLPFVSTPVQHVTPASKLPPLPARR